jgi:hypothetical protein
MGPLHQPAFPHDETVGRANHGERPNPRLAQNFVAMDPLEWLARMADHIPDPGKHRTLLYGHYANRARGARAKRWCRPSGRRGQGVGGSDGTRPRWRRGSAGGGGGRGERGGPGGGVAGLEAVGEEEPECAVAGRGAAVPREVLESPESVDTGAKGDRATQLVGTW